MNNPIKVLAVLLVAAVLLSALGCGSYGEAPQDDVQTESSQHSTYQSEAYSVTTPAFRNLQAELIDDRYRTTSSPIGQFDFLNFTYPLPRGWQNPDGSGVTLVNGRLDPVSVDTDFGMDPDELAERRARRRIGASFVTARYFDVTGDGQDEAIVILKVETAGSAIPQLVYVYDWKYDRPELLWNFRTGDRADGGLKDIRYDTDGLVVELYGQDRFLLGEIETGKITGDEVQLCCPTHFTRTLYKWNGRDFLMRSKRLTYLVADPAGRPIENLGEIVNKSLKRAKETGPNRKRGV